MKRLRPGLFTSGIALAFALAFTLAGDLPAGAQNAPSIEVEPSEVPEPGPTELSVSGTGWPSDAAILILPCDAPESGAIEDVETSTCDTSAVATVTPSGGSFAAVVLYDVPPEGLAIAATDSDQLETAVALVTVQDSTAPQPEPTPPDPLPDTGSESGLLLVVAISAIIGGAMLVAQTRRSIAG